MSVLPCLLIAAVLSAGNDEFERAAVRGAAEIAVGRMKAEAASAACATGALAKAMLADPARFAARDAARKAGEAVYLDAVSGTLARDARAALTRLAGSQSPEEAFGTNFVRAACQLTDEDRGRILGASYGSAFESARQTACEEQARSLVSVVRPPMTAVDSDDESSVRRTLVDNISRQGGRAVFEENLAYVSQKLVDPLLEDAKREKRRQQEYVRRVRADSFAPSLLRADIAAKLEANVRERAAKTDNAALRWGIFPSVTNRTLDAAVESRVLARLVAKVETTSVGLDEAGVRAAYASEPSVHRRASKSREAFCAARGPKMFDAARDAAVADAPKSEWTELTSCYEALRGAPSVTKALDARFAADLDPLLKRVRAGTAADDFEAHWKDLAAHTWFPAPELADDLVARSDFAAAVRRWRELPELKTFDRRGVLEETDALVDRAVRESFEIARAAVAGQTKTVDAVTPEVLAEARDRKNSFFSRTPDLKAIVKLLTEATSERWVAGKNAVLWPDGALPSNADEQHAELFPSVKRRIELVAKEILAEMEKPEPEDPPEEPPPEETPPEEPKLEYAIIVTRNGDRVAVKLEQSGSSVVSRETDAKLAPFRSAMKEVADRLGAEILKLK